MSRAVQPARLRPVVLAGALFVLAVVAVTAAAIGPAGIRPGRALAALADRLPFVSIDTGLTDRQAAVIWELRVPRVVLGGLVGAVLAVAGGAYQGVFRNPLADPYLLGVAAGAGLGATIAIAYGEALPGATVPPAAFIGALAAVLAAYTVGRAAGRRSRASLILAGVAVAAFFTAAQTLLQQLRAETIREVYGWILGRLSTVGWHEVLLLLPYALVSAVVLLLYRRHLDVLAVGEEEASTLGVRAERVRLIVVVAATLGAAAAVAVSGLIGFVGIVVPHVVRLLTGSSYRVILPLSLIGGAAFVILADLLARTVVAGGELPIGVVTAFVGAPFFGFILWRTGRQVAA